MSLRLLFVPSYSHGLQAGAPESSDSMGYGITSAAALVTALRSMGFAVDVLSVGDNLSRTQWVGSCLSRFEHGIRTGSYDFVLAFHAFWPFAADLRRILDDSGRNPVLVAYTHGSHWDPTDLFRHERYPNLEWADLGNVLALDRVLVVSEWMRDTLLANVSCISKKAALALDDRMRVVGLPVDLARVESARREPEPVATVVFNHAPITAKQPGVFLDIAGELLSSTPARVLVTRKFEPGSDWDRRSLHLADRFPQRFVLGNDLPIDHYFSALWASTVQVSTATHESLGMATLEAMATLNHCLLPQRCAYPEIVGNDADVLYSDERQLLSGLKTVIDDRARQTRVSLRLQERVYRLYSPTVVATKIHDVLMDTLRTQRSAS